MGRSTQSDQASAPREERRSGAESLRQSVIAVGTYSGPAVSLFASFDRHDRHLNQLER